MTDHALRYDINLSILFTELPLLQRPAAAAEAGFTAVEFWWPFDVAVPDGDDVDRFAEAIEDAGVQLVGLTSSPGTCLGAIVGWCPGPHGRRSSGTTSTLAEVAELEAMWRRSSRRRPAGPG